MTLFILTRHSGSDKEEARLMRLKNWAFATSFILQWAGKAPCRLAEITEELAKKLYPKLVIETGT